ncbi:MAG: ABC transporter substrate-binding protein [Candidatus Flexifilum sp.]
MVWVALLLVLVGVPFVSMAQDAPSGTISLYTSESEAQVNEMVALFNETYPDVTVNIFRAGSGEVLARLQAEREAGAIGADLLWFADIDYFSTLAEDGLLVEYIPAGTEEVDDMFTYENGLYHEVRLIFNVVAYNTELVEQAPTGWADMLDPAYMGRVTMPSALISGAAFNQFGTFMNREEFGIDFYNGLNANGIVVERANGAVAEKIASGEYAIGQLVDFMARNAAAQGSPVAYVYPVEGAMLVPTPIGIFNTTQNLPAAQAFIDFLYSEAAQNLFVAQNYIPVVPGIELPEGMPEFNVEAEDMTGVLPGVTIIMPDLEYIRANRDTLRAEFEALFGAPPA